MFLHLRRIPVVDGAACQKLDSTMASSTVLSPEYAAIVGHHVRSEVDRLRRDGLGCIFEPRAIIATWLVASMMSGTLYLLQHPLRKESSRKPSRTTPSCTAMLFLRHHGKPRSRESIMFLHCNKSQPKPTQPKRQRASSVWAAGA